MVNSCPNVIPPTLPLSTLGCPFVDVLWVEALQLSLRENKVLVPVMHAVPTALVPKTLKKAAKEELMELIFANGSARCWMCLLSFSGRVGAAHGGF